jgi:hypothetical protein
MARCFHLAPSTVSDHLNLDSQVRLIAAQLVALVEKVGDKDKVKRNLLSSAMQHLTYLNSGATFQEEHQTSNLGDD